MYKILPILFLGFMTATSVLLFLTAVSIWVLTFWWDRRLALLHRFTCFWGSLYSWTMPAWPLTIEGKENIRRNATYVFVSNHQSLLDILMYFRLFVHFKWVSKAEIFRVPLVGWNMTLNRYIGINRGDRESGINMLAQCRKTLDEGSSIFMFPEGTRSRDGSLGRFKTGAFRLAKEARVSIIPMTIKGTAHALPKKSLDFHGKHPISIKVLSEIPYDGFKDKPLEQLAQEVRAMIEDELKAPASPVSPAPAA